MSHPADHALLQAQSDGALKATSNATIFKRGQAYAQSDAVQAVGLRAEFKAKRNFVAGLPPG